MEPICQQKFNAQQLVTRFPAKLSDRNKNTVFGMSSPPGAVHAGTISFSRWRLMPLPETFGRGEGSPSFELREKKFTYDPSTQDRVDWHLNFADYNLFFAHDGPLFAQDEMQVAEHPALASLRQGLLESGLKPVTGEDGYPTPVLIMGVERRCDIATDPNDAEGRQYGLYGNQFSVATEDVVRRATKIIDPPTISNILAVEAPSWGRGRYTREQIESVFATAYTGFAAVVFESKENVASDVETAVHTGYWGCGAYGGNPVLMTLLQMVAACGSGINAFVFHSGSDSAAYKEALEILEWMSPPGKGVKLDDLLSQIEGMWFEWGVGNGT